MTMSAKRGQQLLKLPGIQLGMLLVGTLLFSLLLTQLRPQTSLVFDVGTTPLPAAAQASLYPAEHGGGRTFQHSKATARLPMTELGSPQQLELVFDSHELQPITFRVGPYKIVDATPRTGFRRYHLLIPPQPRGQEVEMRAIGFAMRRRP